MRSTGNLAALKVSYATLAIVPFLGDLESRIDGLEISATWFLVAFLSSLALAVANLIFDLSCPVIIKRFPSPVDMWKDMLQIRHLAISMYPEEARSDGYQARWPHVEAAYSRANRSSGPLRVACWYLYISAAAGFAIVFAERLWSALRLLG